MYSQNFKQAEQIVSQCKSQHYDGKRQYDKYSLFQKENDIKKENFTRILGILRELEDNEAGVIETLFDYKMNDVNDQENESKYAIREFRNAIVT